MTEKISSDQFELWLEHPLTRALHAYLTGAAKSIRDDWSNGENWTEASRIEVGVYEAIPRLTLEDLTEDPVDAE